MWHQLSSIAGVATITFSQSSPSGLARLPVTSQRCPWKPRAAASVVSVPPSWLTQTRMSACVPRPSTSSRAWIAGPAVWAAWYDVPQPVKITRAPWGSRSSTCSSRSQVGCAAIPRLVCSPATGALYHGRVAVFERDRLGNGVRVVTAPMPHAQSSACLIMLAAGSRYETAETNGIAHFAEHMFFKGTERRPTSRAISSEIDGIGGEFNAFTGKEYTGYYVKCAAESRDVALDVLVDMLRNSLFDAEEIDREKGVIVEEMNMYFDTPRDFIGGVYEELLYGDQPLGWHVIGRKETVRAATRETFLSYIDRWYRPERLVIGVGGQVGDDLPGRLEELLGDIEPRDTGAPAPLQDASANGTRVHIHHKASDQAHLVLGVRSLPLGHPDRYALQLLATVLGGGMSSRLFTEVRERRGLAYYVFGVNHSYTDAGSLYSQAGVDIARVDQAVETIVAELRKIADEPVPSEELEKARRFAKGRFVLGLESPHATIMFGLRREVLEGAVTEPADVLAGLEAVTGEDVQRLGQELIGGGGLNLALIGPFEDDAERFEKLLTA